MAKPELPDSQSNFSCVKIQASTSGGQINGIAPFKDYIPPYGAFANTTPMGDYPVSQDKTLSGKMLTVHGKSPVVWPSSENAYHAQKIIRYKEKLEANNTSDPKIQVLDNMLNKLTQTTYMPKIDKKYPNKPTFEKLVNDNLADLGFNNKLEFDAVCDANYHKQHAPNKGLNSAGLPHTYDYMKFVIKMKLEQHPELASAAKEWLFGIYRGFAQPKLCINLVAIQI